MMSIILRRSSSLATRRAVAAASVSVEALLHHVSASLGLKAGNVETTLKPSSGAAPGFGMNGARGFHVKSGPLEFRATLLSPAEYAIAESYESSGNDEGLEIAKLGISQEIIAALGKRGINKLFPIQKAVLEPAMQGRDMIGRAKTGTGKTLAFGIPVVDSIIHFNKKHGRGRNPQCLVLAPTRELAKQVEKELRESAPSLDTMCVYGGTPISRQMRELDYGIDIVVGTPGRVIDLLNRGALNLGEVRFLVLDEADRMLEVGFAEDVETIMVKVPSSRQTLMFSATMPAAVRNLTRKYLNNPLMIDLVGDSDQKLAEGITLYSYVSDMYGKASVIGPLITEHAKGGKCIVFTQTKRDADRLAYAMSRNFRCEALHGDISQSQRERTLSGFRDGHFNVLVATDVAARGLDIPNVDLVVHYEIPTTAETFVHRTGRTGRAGKKGSAILIYSPEEARTVRIFEREVGCRFKELSKIAVEGGGMDMFMGMGAGGRRDSKFGSFGGSRDQKFGNRGFGAGGQAESRFGRSGGYRNTGFGYADDGGQFSGRKGSHGGTGSGRFGSGRSGGFGESGGSDRSSGFGSFGSGRTGGFGDFGSGHSGASGGFNSGRNSRFGDLGSGLSDGFGNLSSGRSSESGGFSFGNSSSRFGDLGSSRPSGFDDKVSGQSGLGNSQNQEDMFKRK